MSADKFTNPEGSKPEWFSLVEADTRVQRNPRDRGIRVMALAAPLLLVSAGLLFAQSNGGQNAVATESTSISSPATNQVGPDPVTTASEGSSSLAVSSVNSNSATVSTTRQPATTNNKVASPAIGQEFVPPAPRLSPAASSNEGVDDALEGASGSEEDDSFEHEVSDEGDDD